MFLKILHAVGFTNLSSEQIDRYYEIKAEFSIQFDRYIYLLCLLTGGLGIFFGAVSNSILISVSIPIVSMTVFILVSKNESINAKADSVYYLGFLFTMISLLSTLFMFGQEYHPNLHSNKMMTVANYQNYEGQFFDSLFTSITGFGVALVTTTYGLIYKTYKSDHFKYKKDDHDTGSVFLFKEGKKEFGEFYNEMKSSIDGLSTNYKSVVNETHSSLLKINRQLELSTEKMQMNLEAQIESQRILLDKNTENYSYISKEIIKSVKVLSENLEHQICFQKEFFDNNLDAFAKSQSEINSSINKLENSVVLQGVVLEKYIGTDGLLRDNLDGMSSIINITNDYTSSIGQAAKTMTKMPVIFENLSENIMTATDNFENMTKLWEKQITVIEDYQGLFERLKEEYSSDYEFIKAIREQMEKDLMKSKTYLSKVHEDLSKATGYIVDEISKK